MTVPTTLSRPRPGDVYGTATVLRKVRNKQRWLVRCSCGHEHELGMGGLLAQHAKANKSCYMCRWDRPGNKMREPTLIPCLGCGKEVRRLRSTAGRERCEACRLVVLHSAVKRRARATKGRVCVGCKRTDTETRWSKGDKLCGACARAGDADRNGRCSCGAPLWRGQVMGPGSGPRDKLPLRCRAGCGGKALSGINAVASA